MFRDDLRLIFETERRIFERRLRSLFPSGTTAPHLPRPAPPKRRPGSRAGRPPGSGSAESPANPAGRSAAARPGIWRARFRTPPRRIASRGWVHLVASLAVHSLLLTLFLEVIVGHVPPPEPERSLTIRYVARVPREQLAPPTPEPEPEPEPPPAPEPDPPEVEAPPAEVEEPAREEEPPEPAEPSPEPPGPPEPTPGLEGLSGGGAAGQPASPLGARYGTKAAALGRFGGTPETEHAVSAGLAWLAAHQDADGSWSPDGFRLHCPPGHACTGGGFGEYRVGVTGLALLAFLGAGVTGAPEHPYHQVVERGLEFLLALQDEGGCFGARQGNYMYNHAIATFCVAEAALLTDAQRLRAAAERGLAFSAASQQPGGGWDYTAVRSLRNDLSITGWQVMAIHTARQARIPFDARMVARLRRYVSRAVHASGWSTYSDRGIGEGRGGVSIAAVGMLTRLYLGWSPRATELERTVRILLRHPPDDEARIDWERSFQSSYYWYYATLSLFHRGGEPWEAWNVLLQREVLPLQSDRHHMAGSWDPDPNWIGGAGGRVATTALVVLTFEVYYRYTPLWEKLGLKER